MDKSRSKATKKKSPKVNRETKAIFTQRLKERMAQMAEETKTNARMASLLAQATGLDPSKLPDELAREIQETSEWVRQAKPPSLRASKKRK
jgi:hypothetical protein